MVLQALDIYPDQVEMVYHHYPSSEFGQIIAEALEAADEQGRFWDLHDRLLMDMPHDMSELEACAADTGLDMQRFGEALDTGRFTEAVELAKQVAVSRGVGHVAVFINGREYRHSPGTLSDLRDAIDEELESDASDGCDET